jgi:outer membrane protein assembly factor BamB
MKQINNIKDVNSVLVDKDGIYIELLDGLYTLNRELLKKADYFNSSGNYIYGYSDNVTFVKEHNLFKNIVEGYKSGCTIFSYDEILCYKINTKDHDVIYYFYNKGQKIEFGIEGRNTPITLYKDKICFTNRVNDIFLFDSYENEKLWSYHLPEGFKIFGSVQVIDDVLFFSCTDNHLNNSQTIGLEISTGKQLWAIKNTVDFQVDIDNKLLRGYGGRYYQVLDPNKGELVINKDMKEYYDEGISPYALNNTITQDRLWFISGRGERVKFGAINLETSEIAFIEDFPLDNNGQLNKPVYHEGKLYLLDSNNVLHILE